jgi:ribosomal protein S18 acetylase RimI-like enzyme
MPSRPFPTQIRRARSADLTAVRGCARAAYARYVPAIGREPAPMVADFERHIRAGEVWVADCEGEVLGYIVFFPKKDTMFLENVAVHPDHAGRGIGRQLITLFEDAANTARLRAVTLYTNEKMTENLSLYTRLGYRETERRYEDGFNRVYFEKRL